MEIFKLFQAGQTGADVVDCPLRLAGLWSHQVAPLVAGDKGGTIGSHKAGHVRAEHVDARNFFKGAQDGVVVKGSALDDNLCSDVAGAAQFYYFEQRVLDYRIRKACGNVGDRGSFLLRLLYAAVHKDGAAASQVHRLLCGQSLLAKLADVHSHRAGKVVQEASAAGRASLVKLDRRNRAVLHAKALHVLAADVQKEFNAGNKKVGRPKVSDCLNLAGVNAQGRLEKRLAVTGGNGARDVNVFGKARVQVL